MSTAVQVVPSNLQVPAHLQSPDIAAAIAAANAAAAGGVRAGGFPTISLKANKFNIKDGGETQTLMAPAAAPGQPPLPMMCLEVVIVAANPALSHTFFAGDYVEGENKEPDCRSSNGITPDAEVAVKQSASCANCPQYAWGSAVSKLTGKPIRACSDSKQLAVVPAGDLAYKMLGLQVGPGSLTNWGQYVAALSGRGYGISTLVTNITFDQAKTGVLQFTFNRFLTEAEYIKVNERTVGDDVQRIVAQSRTIAPVAALAAPVATVGLAAPVEPTQPVPAAATIVTGFGASAPAQPAPTGTFPTDPAPAAEPTAPAPTTPAPTAAAPFAGLPPHVEAACTAVGGLNSPAGMATYKALTGVDYMDLVKAGPAAVSPFEGLPAHVEVAVNACGGLGTVAGAATYKALTGKDAPGAAAGGEPAKRSRKPRTPAAVPEPAAAASPIVTAAASAGVTLSSTGPDPVINGVAAPQTGFGAAATSAVQQQPTAQVVAAGASLADKLRAKLAGGA